MKGFSPKENLLLVTGMTMGGSITSFTFAFLNRGSSDSIMMYTGLAIGTMFAIGSLINYWKLKKFSK